MGMTQSSCNRSRPWIRCPGMAAASVPYRRSSLRGLWPGVAGASRGLPGVRGCVWRARWIACSRLAPTQSLGVPRATLAAWQALELLMGSASSLRFAPLRSGSIVASWPLDGPHRLANVASLALSALGALAGHERGRSPADVQLCACRGRTRPALADALGPPGSACWSGRCRRSFLPLAVNGRARGSSSDADANGTTAGEVPCGRRGSP